MAGLPLFAATAGTKLPDVVMDPAKAKLTREPFGELRIFFDGPTDQLSAMTAGSLRLNPGAEPHPPHEHPEEEFLLVTEGAGEILIDGKTTKVAPGAMMYSRGGLSHGIRNTGAAPMLFYFWKWRK